MATYFSPVERKNRAIEVYHDGSGWPSPYPPIDRASGEYYKFHSEPHQSAAQPTMADDDQWWPHPDSAIYATLSD